MVLSLTDSSMSLICDRTFRQTLSIFMNFVLWVTLTSLTGIADLEILSRVLVARCDQSIGLRVKCLTATVRQGLTFLTRVPDLQILSQLLVARSDALKVWIR